MDSLRAMKYFVRVVDAGSFAAAARELDVSPPAVTQLIAALERELRYYRRVIPVLARASAKPRGPSHEHAGELTHLARWLTDGHRMIGSVSQILAEQPELEIRLEALERAHRQIRDEVAHLVDGEVDERAADPGMFGSSWFPAGLWVRAGLVALILVIVAIMSVPYFIDWWQAMIQPRHG